MSWLHLINSFLSVRVEGRNCQSDLQYSIKHFQSFLGKAIGLNFLGKYAGKLTYFYLLICIWFPRMESIMWGCFTKATTKLSILSMCYSFIFLLAFLFPFHGLGSYFSFQITQAKLCVSIHSFLLIISIEQGSWEANGNL